MFSNKVLLKWSEPKLIEKAKLKTMPIHQKIWYKNKYPFFSGFIFINLNALLESNFNKLIEHYEDSIIGGIAVGIFFSLLYYLVGLIKPRIEFKDNNFHWAYIEDYRKWEYNDIIKYYFSEESLNTITVRLLNIEFKNNYTKSIEIAEHISNDQIKSLLNSKLSS